MLLTKLSTVFQPNVFQRAAFAPRTLSMLGALYVPKAYEE